MLPDEMSWSVRPFGGTRTPLGLPVADAESRISAVTSGHFTRVQGDRTPLRHRMTLGCSNDSGVWAPLLMTWRSMPAFQTR